MSVVINAGAGGGLVQKLMQGAASKSAQERAQRQQKTANQVAYWENQKENLKNVKCDSLEEIAEKLEKFHTYESEISAAKQAYNNEQMSHVLDEAQERGEKIAKEAEKNKPKTAEERRKDLAEEAAGTEGKGGIFDELMEHMEEITERLEEQQEEMIEEMPGAAEELTEKLTEDMPEAEELNRYQYASYKHVDFFA